MDWEDVKGILTPMIVLGEIPHSMGPREVYNLPEHKDEFQQVRYDRFRDNLNALRKRIKTWHEKSDFDQVAFEHDKALNPIDVSKLRWPGSAAEASLKRDVDEGKHKTMTPSELRKTNNLYMEWPLDKFRGHIYQEERKRIETPYWTSVREVKLQKKDAARKKRAEKARK